MEGFFSNGAVLFSLFVSLIGLVMIVSALLSMYKARKTEFWRQATGKVLESDVAKNIRSTGGNTKTTTYRPEICYNYQVDDQEYVSDRIGVTGSYSSSSPAKAYRITTKYPVDKEVTVYYDPNKPDQSVLETGVTKEIHTMRTVGIVLMIGALLFAYFSRYF
ncbi:MAG TPA: DUF3592 domain-containing protein [Bacteroides sp.]|nr:DUF3592 domain-containing protein [Bacteroides sp.]